MDSKTAVKRKTHQSVSKVMFLAIEFCMSKYISIYLHHYKLFVSVSVFAMVDILTSNFKFRLYYINQI